ncbi:hypothetical protein HPB50_001610 [Hyalomma asiaticum]|uniref:Uncharacterized protein n=1 Tax=Hyalomma asiaticum TaxID=266040 RepID=A0ACB7RZU1_HYAAI|nr:hypothetical protein HPB50_001610 [Hyalomma asiaticum]
MLTVEGQNASHTKLKSTRRRQPPGPPSSTSDEAEILPRHVPKRSRSVSRVVDCGRPVSRCSLLEASYTVSRSRMREEEESPHPPPSARLRSRGLGQQSAPGGTPERKLDPALERIPCTPVLAPRACREVAGTVRDVASLSCIDGCCLNVRQVRTRNNDSNTLRDSRLVSGDVNGCHWRCNHGSQPLWFLKKKATTATSLV